MLLGEAAPAGFAEDVSSIVACPICVETIEDAFATPCGHTFCYKCISTHLKNKSNCPSCGAHLVQDHIHPNFLLSKLIKHVASTQPSSMKTALLQHVEADLAAGAGSIGLQELDVAIQLLQEKRQHMATHESSNKLQLLLMFLQHAKARQQGKLSDLQQQLEILQQDLARAKQDQQQQQQDVQAAPVAEQGVDAISLSAPAAAGISTAAAVIPMAGLDNGGSAVYGAAATAAAAAAAAGSNHPARELQQQSLQTAATAAGSPAPPASNNSQHQQQQAKIGGPGSAFRRLTALEQQQQDEQQQLKQQQQPVAAASQGFRPFVQAQQQQQLQPKPQQQQQQHSQQQAVGGFRPYSRPSAVAPTASATLGMGCSATPLTAPQPQGSGFQPVQPAGAGFRPLGASGFSDFIPMNLPLNPGQQVGAEGGVGLGLQQGSASGSAGGLNPEKKRKILQQFDDLQQAYINSRMRRSSNSGFKEPGLQQQQQKEEHGEEEDGEQKAALQQQLLQGKANGAGAAAGDFEGASSNPEQQQQQRQSVLPDFCGGAVATTAAAAAAGIPGDSQAGAEAAARGGWHGPGGGLGAAAAAAEDAEASLDAFSDVLSAVTYYNRLSTVAYIPPTSSSTAAGRSSSSSSAYNILSSIEFDCKGGVFAAAGVQQRICVYDYHAIMAASQQQQAALGSSTAAAAAAAMPKAPEPLLDLPTSHKISCMSFSPAVQHYLLSSDYEGQIHLWDLQGGKIVRQWDAHEKRIWAVDACPLDANQFATGSDDGTVKVWGLREPPTPRLVLPIRANVCSLEYAPDAAHLLAVGSAGHQVHLFDLRSPRSALAVLKGHRKAVSCARWAGPDSLVTASTDSTLRLWSLTGGKGSSGAAAATAAACSGGSHSGSGGVPFDGSGSAAAAAAAGGNSSSRDQAGWQCVQVFSGHTNSKHFVGLSTQGPFIACGSETNEVFVYHQGLPKPSMQCMLLAPDETPPVNGVAQAGKPAAASGGSSSSTVAKSPFVSAVCWRKESNVLLAANSRGGVWVLSLVE